MLEAGVEGFPEPLGEPRGEVCGVDFAGTWGEADGVSADDAVVGDIVLPVSV